MSLDDSARALVKKLNPDEIAKLWMNENTVVNQKTAYFIAATAFLVPSTAMVAIAKDIHPVGQTVSVIFLCICGLIIAIVTYLSILRTCSYRDHLRECLAQFESYNILLSPPLEGLGRIRSSTILKGLPIVAIVLWSVVLVFVVAKLLMT